MESEHSKAHVQMLAWRYDKKQDSPNTQHEFSCSVRELGNFLCILAYFSFIMYIHYIKLWIHYDIITHVFYIVLTVTPH